MSIRSRRTFKAISIFLVNMFFIDQISFAAPDLKPVEFNLFPKPLVNFQIPQSIATIGDSWRASNMSSPKSSPQGSGESVHRALGRIPATRKAGPSDGSAAFFGGRRCFVADFSRGLYDSR